MRSLKMTNSYTCSRCGCVHWDELEPISCIMCDNDVFYDSPDKFYENKKENEDGKD